MALGRTTEGRAVSGVGTTNGSGAITGPANSFFPSDVGRPISGTGIAAGATITAVASGTAATVAPNSSATGTITATLGAHPGGLQNAAGYNGWSPETEAEALLYSVLGGGGAAAPTQVQNSYTNTHVHRARG